MGPDLESNLSEGYREAFRLAVAALRGRDPGSLARGSGAVLEDSGRTLRLPYLGVDHRVDLDTGVVVRLGADGPASVGTTTAVLVLHHLLHAAPRPPTGRLVSFRDLRGVSGYWPTFRKRAVLPVLRAFASRPEALVEAGLALGGERASFGDAATTLRIFPFVPVTYVVWRGDEEIPSEASILFDETVASWLPGEDIVLAASFGAYALVRLAPPATPPP